MKTPNPMITTRHGAVQPRQLINTETGPSQFTRIRAAALIVLAASLTFATPAAHAADLLWDANNGTAGAQDGSGTWTNTTGNWRNLTTSTDNQNWVNAATNGNSAIFGAGTDGTYAITLSGAVWCNGITFSNSGYTLAGSSLILTNGTSGTSPSITVVAGKTATINSLITYRNNTVANITNQTDATLNLGGGAGNSQYNFVGGGTVNMTAGTYNANIGKVNVPTFNQSGGTFNITPGVLAGGNGYSIGLTAGQSVNYTLTNATLTVNGNASTATVLNSYLALGRAAGNTAYQNTLTVQDGATVNIGTTASRAGELRIAFDTNSSGKLDVQGGTVTVGTGSTANKIYFFKAGSTAGYTATMTQSGGTVTANGIQFCEVPATLDLASSATLQLSGGSLYVGAQGITLGAGASPLPVTIQLQGGTLGASQNWSSSLDMKLGVTGGGPTIRAQDAAITNRNITLSGILSDDGAVNGTLTKTGGGTLTLSGAGANTFSGATLVSAGTLDLGKTDAVSSSSSVTIASGAALALSTSSSTVPNLTFVTNGVLSFNVVGGGTNLVVSAADGVTNSGPASSVTINITGTAPDAGTYTLIAYSGALQGSGFSAYTLGSTPAGRAYALNDTGSAVELIVLNPFVWTGLDSTEWSTNTIAGFKNWTQGGSPTDYTNGQVAVFDDTTTSNTVDISVADVTPSGVLFNNDLQAYTLQGSQAIAGSAALTKTGSQPLTILNANTYTGGSKLGTGTANLGTVGIGHNSALGSGQITSLGAQLQAVGGARTLTNALTVSAGGLRFGGENDLTLSGVVTLDASRDIGIYSASNTLTLSGGVNLNGWNYTLRGNPGNVPNGTNIISAPITGSGNFAVSGEFLNGVTALSASNTYVGTTTIGSGTLRLATSGVIPDGAGSGAVTVTGTLDLNGFSETINGLSGAGIVDTIAGGTPTLTVGNGNGSGTFTGIIQNTAGTLALVKTGTGSLVLQGANTFAGGVTIKNGTLESKTTTTTLGTGTVVMGGVGSSGATYLTGQGNTNAFTINAPDSGTNIIGANGTGSGFVMTGPVTLNGDLTIQSYFSSSLQSSTARPILTGGITGTGNLILNNLSGGTNTITLQGNPINHAGTITAQGGSLGSNIISAVIGANVTGVTQNSATSPLILSATNTYTGPTTVNAGTMVIAVDSLAASSTVSVAEGAVLQLDFAETNVVAGFSTNGVALPNGVYSAGNVGPFIAGTGSLQVGAAPSGPTPEPITRTVSGGNLILSWTQPSWTLLTGTNVTAVTNIIPGATSPYTNSLSEPKRFYRLAYP